MLLLLSTLLSIVCLFSTKSEGSTLHRSYFVGVGQELMIPGSGRVIVPKQSALKIQADSQYGVRIFGLKPGWTQLKIGSKNIEISILNLKQQQTLEILKQKLNTYFGIKIEVSQGEVRLVGNLFSDQLITLLKETCPTGRCQFVNELQVSSERTVAIRSLINKELKEAALSAGQILFTPQWKMLLPTKSDQAKEIEMILSYLGIKVDRSVQVVSIKSNVKLSLLVVEFRKGAAERLGINWPQEISAQMLPRNLFTEQLTASFIDQAGLGKTLASPSLIARSGADAEFMAGGEIPIRIQGERFAQLTWKKYGVLVKAKPQVDLTGRISIEIECEVSSLDGASAVEGVPGIKSNRIKTHFDMLSGRTILLTGLIRSDQYHVSQGLLGLNQLPVIGSLFGSHDFKNDQSELLIFMTPQQIFPD